ncbi:hypothetical protein Rsub_03267 [Raphidocelis subcapitata]|uniref:Uncharacterized protein n=1 Tax=Raphidocelis subcapitata TaxID=307507 RepID=A0A2V0NR67_9CHLO|nr:hypothetical protein Rsub_03267 [Raphidocelis subcapitata]|eukprot:GBF90134.1 hypothetical protein Rsub_03267 [Raphidocelis subcapitata]
MAALDVLGYLPSPAGSSNRGAADLLDGQLLAYGASASVAVLEVPRLHVACMLHGAHRGASVTAVKWSPDCHSRDLRSNGHVRLASGDSTGGVVVWDVLSASVSARLDDVPAAQELLGSYAAATKGECAVQGLAWVLPDPPALAVVIAPALLLIWDTQGGSLLWKRELAAPTSPETFTSIACDPLNRRRVALCGDAGALVVLRLDRVGDARGGDGGGGGGGGGEGAAAAGAFDEVYQKQYRVNTAAAGGGPADKDARQPALTLQARFCASRDLLVVLLRRELLVFDLDLGHPAASSPLPAGRPAFAGLLGVFGEGVSQGLGDEGGIDYVYTTHADGSLCCWTRRPGELTYCAGPGARLVAPPARGGGGGGGGGGGSQASIVSVSCAVWRDELLGDNARGSGTCAEPRAPPPPATTRAIRRQLATSVEARVDADDAHGGRASRAGEARKEGTGGGGGGVAAPLSRRALLVMVVSSDGRVWQWDAAVPRFPRRQFLTSLEDHTVTSLLTSLQEEQDALAAAYPAAAVPQLAGLFHGLPAGVLAFAVHPRPVLLPAASAPAAAAAAAEAAAGDGGMVGRPTYARRESAFSAAAGAAGFGSHPLLPGLGLGGGALDGPEAAGARAGEARCEVVLGVGGTAAGTLEVVAIHRGIVNPLAAEVSLSLAVHRDAVRGLCWIGDYPLVASFTAERAQPSSSGAAASAPGWRNGVALTCLRTRRSAAFRLNINHDTGPLTSVRASPSGAYLLLQFRGAPVELWVTGLHPDGDGAARPLGGLPRPQRLRYIDLAFAAAEWAQPEDATAPWELREGPHQTYWVAGAGAGDDPDRSRAASPDGGDAASSASGPPAGAAAAAAAAARRTASPLPTATSADSIAALLQELSLRKERSATMDSEQSMQARGGGAGGGGARRGAALALPEHAGEVEAAFAAIAPAHGPGQPLAQLEAALQAEDEMPEERLAFALVDGRSGILTVKARRVADARPKRPTSGPGPQDLLATAVAAAGNLIFLGDEVGALLAWDLVTGKCNLLQTGLGEVRAIRPAPPPCPQLHPSGGAGLDVHVRARLGVLFAGGGFGVFEIDGGGRLRQGVAPPAVCASRVGGAGDLAWLPLPWPVGGGSVLAAALRDGSVALLDACQSGERTPSYRTRVGKVRALLAERHAPPAPPPAAAAEGGGGDAAAAGAAAAASPAAASPCAVSPLAFAARRGGGGGGDGGRGPFAAAAGAAGAQPFVAVLAPAQAVGNALLMRRPWALLLRLMLQLGLSQDSIQQLSGPHAAADAGAGADADADTAVASEISSLLPRAARRQILRLAAARREAREAGLSGLSPVGSGGLSASGRQPGSPAAAPPAASGRSGLGGGLFGFVTGGFAASAQRQASGSPRRAAARAAPGALSSQGSGGSSAQPPAGAARAGSGLARAATLARADATKSVADWAAATGGGAFDGELAPLLRHIARLRARGQLLHPDERRAYSEALARGSTAERMAVAARVTGDTEEARFWAHLPATLEAVREMAEAARARAAEAAAAAAAADEGTAGGGGAARKAQPPDSEQQQEPPAGAGLVMRRVRTGRAVRLWDDELAVADAQERCLWHEAMPRAIFDSPPMQERRVLEYVSLGDAHTAVALLLSSPPERSEVYYRFAAMTLALAAPPPPPRGGGGGGGGRGGGGAAGARATLQLQAAKVLSAHTSSVGDTLLGVPLSVAVGLVADAVLTLQDEGMWQLAATLTARGLRGADRAHALQRWAQHVWREEGGMWRAAGLLTAGGCLRGALRVLRDAGLPDCAAAFIEACREAGLLLPPGDGALRGGIGGSALSSPARSAPSSPAQRGGQEASSKRRGGGGDGGGGPAAAAAAALAAAAAAARQGGGGSGSEGDEESEEELEPLVLFDVLGGGTQLRGSGHPARSASSAGSVGSVGSGGGAPNPLGGSEELSAAAREFESYCSALFSRL